MLTWSLPIERRAIEAQAGDGFDIDAVLSDDLTIPERPPSPITMDDLDRVIASPDLMPQGTQTQQLGHREYGLLAPGMTEPVRATTDPAYYEEHSESVELWSTRQSPVQARRTSCRPLTNCPRSARSGRFWNNRYAEYSPAVAPSATACDVSIEQLAAYRHLSVCCPYELLVKIDNSEPKDIASISRDRWQSPEGRTDSAKAGEILKIVEGLRH